MAFIADNNFGEMGLGKRERNALIGAAVLGAGYYGGKQMGWWGGPKPVPVPIMRPIVTGRISDDTRPARIPVAPRPVKVPQISPQVAPPGVVSRVGGFLTNIGTGILGAVIPGRTGDINAPGSMEYNPALPPSYSSAGVMGGIPPAIIPIALIGIGAFAVKKLVIDKR